MSGERLFFALWPGREQRDAIAVQLPDMPRAARPVPPENWHVTLAFLGDVAAERRQAYESAAGAVASRPFELALDHFGYFHRSRVLWLGASAPPDRLRALHADLSVLLAGAGHEPDPRPFAVHLTLARKMPPPGELPAVRPVNWGVGDFCLVRSVLGPGGARYDVVRRFPLTGA